MFLQNKLVLRSLKHYLTHQCFPRTGWLWGHWNTTSHINVSPEQVGSEVIETLPHTSMFPQNRLVLRSLKHYLTHQCFSRTGWFWGHWNTISHINVSPEQVGSEVIETLPHTSMFLQNRLVLRSLKHYLTHQCFSRTGWFWGHWNTTSHINVSPEHVGSEVIEILPHTSMFLQNKLALKSLKHYLTHQCFSRTGWLWGHWNTISHINVSPEQVGSEVIETLPHTSMFPQNRLVLRSLKHYLTHQCFPRTGWLWGHWNTTSHINVSPEQVAEKCSQ